MSGAAVLVANSPLRGSAAAPLRWGPLLRCVVITGVGVSGADAIRLMLIAIVRSLAIRPIEGFDTTGWPGFCAAEIVDFNARSLVDDRKLHKLIRRTDMLGICATAPPKWPDTQRTARHCHPMRRTRPRIELASTLVLAPAFENQHDFFPLMSESNGDLQAFGRNSPTRSIRCGCRTSVQRAAPRRHSNRLKGMNVINNHRSAAAGRHRGRRGAAPRRSRSRARDRPRHADRRERAVLPSPRPAGDRRHRRRAQRQPVRRRRWCAAPKLLKPRVNNALCWARFGGRCRRRPAARDRDDGDGVVRAIGAALVTPVSSRATSG